MPASCKVAQIVKSLVFENEADGKLVLCLTSGINQVDIAYLSDAYGISLKRCDTRRVRDETGFAIGGVAPIGHINPITVLMDETLLGFRSCLGCSRTTRQRFQGRSAGLGRGDKTARYQRDRATMTSPEPKRR